MSQKDQFRCAIKEHGMRIMLNDSHVNPDYQLIIKIDPFETLLTDTDLEYRVWAEVKLL